MLQEYKDKCFAFIFYYFLKSVIWIYPSDQSLTNNDYYLMKK